MIFTNAAIAALLICAGAVQAGGPGPAQRLYRVGSCGAGGPPCEWQCPSRQNPNCDGGLTCEIHPVQAVAAHLVIEADDSSCPNVPGTQNKNGAVVTLKLAGRKPDRKPFKIPDRTIDLCGVNLRCGDCDPAAGCQPTSPSCPRAPVFLCDNDNQALTERNLPNTEWLAEMQVFPPGMAEDISAALGVAGVPVVVKPIQLLDQVDNSKSPQPSVKQFCIKIWMVPSVRPGSAPDSSGLTEEESPSSLDNVDCPAALCGDGVRDPDEECDDGNREGHDDCDKHCRSRGPRRSAVHGHAQSTLEN